MNLDPKQFHKQRAARKCWLFCLLAGLSLLCFGPYLMTVFPADGAGYNPQYGSPVFAFEFARSKADLLAIFGESTDAARPGRIQAMDRGHYLDFVFAVLYSAFLASFFVAAHRLTANRYLLYLAGICVLAGIADIIENIILIGLTRDLETARYLAYLVIPVQLKFLCLAATGIGAGYALIAEQALVIRKVLSKALGFVALFSSLIVLPGIAWPEKFGFLVGHGITVTWLILLLYAGIEMLTRKQR